LDSKNGNLNPEIVSEAHNCPNFRCLFVSTPPNLDSSDLDQNKSPEAIDASQKALLFQPNSPHALSLLANAYFRANQYEDAAELFRKALAVQPDSPDDLSGLGMALMAANDSMVRNLP
jgi:cytochrome c-type biogenesis protein CcmH/NrfG